MSESPQNTQASLASFFSQELKEGETLLASIYGNLVYDGSPYTQRPAAIALTPSRLIWVVVPWRNKEQKVFSLPLAAVQRMTFNKSPLAGVTRGLRLEIGRELYSIRCEPEWLLHVEQFVSTFVDARSAATSEPTPADWVDTAVQLADLDVFTGAKQALSRAQSGKPGLSEDPVVVSLQKSIRDSIWALRTGGIFLCGLLVFFIMVTLLGAVIPSLTAALLAVLISINLLIGKSNWRTAGIVVGLLNAIINILTLFLAAWNPVFIFDLILWVCFGTAVTLVLSGRPSQNRIYLAAALYLIGMPGMLLLGLLLRSFGLV